MSARGYSLLEMVMTMAIVSVVAAGGFRLIDAAHRLSRAGEEAADMMQRFRVAGTTLETALVRAGAGASNDASGGLAARVPAVVPSIVGELPGVVRDDAVTIVYAREGAAQTTIADALTGAATVFTVNEEPGCPLAQPACGLSLGDTVVVYDVSGHAGFFSITGVSGAGGTMTPQDASGSEITYSAGSSIVPVERRSYFLKPDSSGRPYQLVESLNGSSEAIPLVDDVVALRFDYFDDPRSLTPVPLAALDPLRVRAVAVTVRIDAGSDALRGPAGPLFTRGGTASDVSRALPDLELQLHVSLRSGAGAE